MKNKILAIAFASLLIAVFNLTPCASAKKTTKKECKSEIAIVAHRGFWNCDEAGYAKNSIAALVQAQKHGFWGSEFDVNMTADGELLVFHDSSIDGKLIEKHNASEFADVRIKNGEKIPTLDEYLEQGAKCKSTMLVFEMKKHSCKEVEDKAVALAIQKLREHKLLKKNRVMFISFSMNICKEFARLAPGFTVQYLGSDLSAEEVYNEGVNGIDANQGHLLKNSKYYKQAREKSMSVNVWTVNDKERMEKFIELGVDQITTDKPLVLRELLTEKGAKEVR